jgi:hypothetical protein
MDQQKRIRLWRVIACSTALFYLLSFGPLTYALAAFTPSGPMGEAAVATLHTLYRPHHWLRDHTRLYYGYANWWTKMARPDIPMMSWEDWRDYQRHSQER